MDWQNLLAVNGGPFRMAMFRGFTKDEFEQTLAVQWATAITEASSRLSLDILTATDPQKKLIWDAAKLWATYQLLRVLSGIHAGLPTQATEVNLSASYNPSAKNLRELSDDYKEDFEAFINEAKEPAPEPQGIAFAGVAR